MKKSLLALAILGAFTGTASAQTNLTIYGVADVGITRFDNGAVTTNRLDSGIQSGSRLGFRGTEDLGGGLSAIFTLENGFGIDTGTLGQGGRLFGRQAFVGLSSGVGALKFGRQNNPIRGAVEGVDPFGIGLAGNASNVFNVYGDRADNTINYSLPSNMGGLKGELAYSLGEVAGSNSIGRHLGASVGYAAGPINVVLAHHNQNLVTGTADAGNAKTTFLGGSWDFNVAKLHAAFAVNDGETAAGVTSVDSKDAMLGVSAPVGAGRILASFIRRSDDIVGSADADQWALGYTYDLSKRTNFYTSYARTKNDAGSSLGVGASAGGAPAAAGSDPSVFNVGIRHRF